MYLENINDERKTGSAFACLVINNMTSIEWKTEQRKINDLIPYENNPRQMTEDQVEALKRSLLKFNLVEIPAINTDNQILAGHQRLKILQTLGRGDEIIDVRVPTRALTKEESREYLIRSNKNTGGWDWGKLANEFEVSDLKDWGFSDADIGNFQSEIEPEEESSPVPSVPEQSRAEIGKIYQLGKHRVMCGIRRAPRTSGG